MATRTVVAPANNTFVLAERMYPLLDETYRYGAVSRILDTPAERVLWTGAKTANIFTVDTVGLGNYSRNEGYLVGDVNGAWNPYTIEIDRGRSFMVDVMDNEETLNMAFGSLIGAFMREQVTPEVDAYRFAKYAGAEDILKGDAAAITDSTDAAGMLDAASDAMNAAEVPTTGRIAFVSPAFHRQLRKNIGRTVANGVGVINDNVTEYNDLRIVTVPQSRFNTEVTLNAPASSSDMGGYTASGAPINFMVIHPSAIIQVVKHEQPRVFSPLENQQANAWKFDYRIYHDCFVRKNKAAGIYLSAGV